MTSPAKKKFPKDDSATVTIDWIVLTTNLIGLAVVIIASAQAGSSGLVAHLGEYIPISGYF